MLKINFKYFKNNKFKNVKNGNKFIYLNISLTYNMSNKY